MLCRAPKAYPFPPEKEAPNSKPGLVVLTAFLAPSKAIAFGHTPLRRGWQDENLILGELGLGRTRGEMKAGSSAIAANLVVGAGLGGFTASSLDPEGDIQWSNAW